MDDPNRAGENVGLALTVTPTTSPRQTTLLKRAHQSFSQKWFEIVFRYLTTHRMYVNGLSALPQSLTHRLGVQQGLSGFHAQLAYLDHHMPH